jgi:hypothetical protein
MRYQVVLKRGRSHYILGFPSEYSDDPDYLLIYHYPGGDIDTHMTTAEMMQNALYDAHQCNDGLKEGDIFETEFGEFVCQGLHVKPVATALHSS